MLIVGNEAGLRREQNDNHTVRIRVSHRFAAPVSHIVRPIIGTIEGANADVNHTFQ